MDTGVIEGGLNVTLTIRLLMHGKVSVHRRWMIRVMTITLVVPFTHLINYCVVSINSIVMNQASLKREACGSSIAKIG